MEHALVLDANIVVKRYLVEEDSDIARALVNNSIEAGRNLYAPLHFQSEVVNTIHKHQYQGNITSYEADQAIGHFFELPFILISSEELHFRAVLFSRERGIGAIYDSLYAVLAESIGAEFWTNDQRFIRQAGPSAPWIRWLGDYEPR